MNKRRSTFGLTFIALIVFFAALVMASTAVVLVALGHENPIPPPTDFVSSEELRRRWVSPRAVHADGLQPITAKNAAGIFVIQTLQLNAFAGDLAFSWDNLKLAITSLFGVQLYDAQTLDPETAVFLGQNEINAVAFSPDRKLIAAFGSETLHIWDYPTLTERSTVKLQHASDLTFNPDSSTLVWTQTHLLGRWDMATQTQGTMLLSPSPIGSFAFTSNGENIVTGDHDGNLKLWDIPEEKPQKVIAAGKLIDSIRVVSSLDGTLLAVSNGSTIQVLDMATWQERMSLATAAIPILFSPDATILVTSEAGNAALWDIATATRLTELPGNRYTAFAFSPDGMILATGRRDGYFSFIQLWGVPR